jgi:hypothetical protein
MARLLSISEDRQYRCRRDRDGMGGEGEVLRHGGAARSQGAVCLRGGGLLLSDAGRSVRQLRVHLIMACPQRCTVAALEDHWSAFEILSPSAAAAAAAAAAEEGGGGGGGGEVIKCFYLF